MSHPPETVRYSFPAADEVSRALGQLAAKIEAYAGLRSQLHAQKLECPDAPPTSVPWRGGRRRRFDHEFSAQQKELRRLALEAAALKRLVDKATEEARAAHK